MFFAAVYDDLVEDDKAHDDIVAALTQAITDLGVPVVSLNVAPGSIVATVLTSSEEHQTLLDDLVRQGSVSIMFRQVQLSATANPTPRDCKLDWAPWGSCSVSCGNGTHQRQQFIVALEDDGGQPCSPLMTESRTCVNSPCLSVQTTVAPSNDQQGEQRGVNLFLSIRRIQSRWFDNRCRSISSDRGNCPYLNQVLSLFQAVGCSCSCQN